MNKIFTIVFLFCIFWGQAVLGTVTVTPAAFGSNVTADYALNASPQLGGFSVGTITISEGANKDFNNGTFIIDVPSWAWNFVQSGVSVTGVTATVSYTSASRITINITNGLGNGSKETFNIVGVKVQAIDGANMYIDGNITYGGGTAAQAGSGLTSGSTSLGALSQKGGQAKTFVVESEWGGNIGSQVALTPFNIRITAKDQFSQTSTSFTGTASITSTGTLSAGVVTGSFTAGVITHGITMASGGNFTLTATSGTATGTSNSFLVNNGPPTVSLNIDNATIAENGGVATVTVTLSNAYYQDVGVGLSPTGTAGGGDYTLSSNYYYVTVTAGNLTATVTITAVDDTETEADETVITSITNVNNGTENGVQEVTTTIIDDELPPPSVSLSIDHATIAENGGVATVTVTLSNTYASAVGVQLSPAGGTAGGGDYSFNPYYVSIAAGNLTGTATVTGTDDAISDPGETVVVSITSVSNGTENGVQEVTTTIIDDDTPGITVAPISGLSTTEDGGSDEFSVVLNTQPANDVTITLSSDDVGEGTISPSSITFTDLDWDTPQTITITGVADLTIDGDIAYHIITNAATSTDPDYNGLNADDVSVTNIDNGIEPLVTFSSGSLSSVGESSTLLVTVGLNVTLGVDVTVPFTINGASTATGGGVDYTISSSSALITAGNTTATITITIVPDALDENNETVILNMGNPTNATQGAITTFTATITDDDSPPSVAFTSSAQASSNEVGNTTMTITAQLSAASSFNVSVPFSVNASSTATGGGTDYNINSSPLSITAGNTSANITITIVSDVIVEGDETVIVDLGAPTNATLGGTITHTATITDDDLGAQTLAVSSSTICLGNSITLTATVSNPIKCSDISYYEYSTDAGSNWSTLPATGVCTTTDTPVSAGSYLYRYYYNKNGNSGTSNIISVTVNPYPAIAGIITGSSTIDLNATSVSYSVPTIANATSYVWSYSGTGATINGNTEAINIDFSGATGGILTVYGNNSCGNGTVSTGFPISISGFTVTESGGSTITSEGNTTDDIQVVLNARPASNVIILIGNLDTSEGTLSASSLTFTNTNWSTPQTITVTGVDESLVDGDISYNLTFSIDDANSNDAFDPLANQIVQVTNTDNDVAGFTITESGGTTLTSENLTTDNFSVVLNTQPLTNVVITISGLDTSEGSLSVSSLTFTNGNWNTPQSVVLTGVNDVIVDGDISYNLTVSIDDANSDDAFDLLADQTVSVTNSDNDIAGFTITESGGATLTSESLMSDDFSVVLNRQPLADVIILISGVDASEGTLSSSSLTFTNGNWDTPQTITVTGVDDALIDGNISYNLTLSVDDPNSDDAFDPVADQTITVTNTDNDVAGFTIAESSGSTATSEDATSDIFTVVLNSPPTTDVVILITGLDVTEGSLSSSSLTFTNGNWSTPQTVTVTGVNDDIIDGDISYNLTLSIDDVNSDDAYDPVADQIVPVTNIDNDIPNFTITESGGSTSTNESGSSDDFTVVLDVQPSIDVVLLITGLDASEGSISTTSLTFTNSNWATPQTVTLTGVDDAFVDGDISYNLTISVDAANSDDIFDLVASKMVSVTNIDNDTPGFTITQSGGTTTTSETGTSDNFTVVLNTQPLTDVVILISGLLASEGSISATSLTFTNSDWNTPQTVTMTGVDDNVVDGINSYNLTLSIDDPNSDDSYDPVANQTVLVTNTDDDVAGFTIVESSGSTQTSEDLTSDDFTVVLDAQPLTNVVILITGLDATEGSLSTSSLTFTNGNWNTPQTVTVTGVNDILVDGNISYNLTLSVDAANSDNVFDLVANQIVSVTNIDNNVAGFTITETGGTTTTSEGLTSDDFSVVLNAQPVTNVVVVITGLDATEGSLSTSSITFTNGNWATPQTVTVTGVDDALIDGDISYDLTLSIDAANSDDNYDLVASQTVSVTNTDSDVAGFTIAESGGTTITSEDLTSDDFTVVLNTQPATDVVIDITGLDASEGSLSTTSLTFTNGNWNSAQTVTITGVDDALTDGNISYNLTLAINAAASDDAYDLVASQIVSVTNNDNECISGQPSDASVCAGNNASFTVTSSGTVFQWQYNTGAGWNNITGAVAGHPTYANYLTATLGLSNTTAAHNGFQYRCVVSGSCSATSNAATLSVGINRYSSYLSASPGLIDNGGSSVISLSNTQSGIDYQLYENGSSIGSSVAGNGGTISFSSVSPSSSSNYTVTATISGGGCSTTLEDQRTVIVNEDGLIIELTPCSGQPGANFFTNSEFGTTSTNVGPTQPDQGTNPGVVWGNPLGATYTDYTFGFDGGGEVNDGYYVITNSTNGMYNSPDATDSWLDIYDNTQGDGTGHMYVVNASIAPGVFYTETLTGLCDSTKYEFSADIINLYATNYVPNGTAFETWFPTDDQGNRYSILPNIDFLINGKVALNTGNILNDGNWTTFGFTFRTGGLPSITLTMRNNSTGGIGNDLALDNILMRACGPAIELNITTVPAIVCPGNPVRMKGEILASDFNSPVYQWQKSTDGGSNWSNLSGFLVYPDSTVYIESNPTFGTQYRFITAETIPGLTSPNCFVASNVISIQTTADIVSTTPVTSCGGGTVDLYATANTGSTINWYADSLGGVSLQADVETSTYSPTLAATDTFYVDATQNGCTSSPRVPVIATIYPASATAGVSIAANPGTNLCTGNSVTFTATPTNGGGSPTYQWKKNGVNISGATNVSYTSSTIANNDVITCEMTVNPPNACISGSPALSNSLTMTVSSMVANVSIAASPGTTVCEGSSVLFTATPTNGGAIPTYQWKKNNISVGTNSTTYNSSTLVNNDQVACILTSSFACATNNPDTSNVITMVVNAKPTITGTLSVCTGSTTQLTGSGTAAASNPWVSATPAVATVDNTGLVTAVSVGTSVITYTDNNGCSNTATVTVTAQPTISGTLAVCEGSTTQLTGSGTAAASNPWVSATPAVATVDNGGLVAGVSAGTSVIIYTDNNGCSNTATVTVDPSQVASFSYADSPYCTDALNPSPTFSGGGVAGVFSSTAGLVFVSTATGEIDLAASTAGTYTVTNTIAAAGGCAEVTATSDVTITTLPVATFSYADSPYCSDALNPSPTFSGGGVAGVFSSTAGLVFVSIATGEIDLAASTAGTYTVTNTIAAAGGCAEVTATSDVTITSLPVATFSYPGTPYCANGSNPVPTFSGGGVAGVFSSTAGLVFVNSATGEINLAASTEGAYTVINTIAAAGGCAEVTATSTVAINRLNLKVTDVSPEVGSDCPDLDAPFNPDNSNYNAGDNDVAFKVEHLLSTDNQWSFHYKLSGVNVIIASLEIKDGNSNILSPVGTAQEGDVDVSNTGTVTFNYKINNSPGNIVDVLFEVSSVTDGICTGETETVIPDDNKKTHSIEAMPVVGSFN